MPMDVSPLVQTGSLIILSDSDTQEGEAIGFKGHSRTWVRGVRSINLLERQNWADLDDGLLPSDSDPSSPDSSSSYSPDSSSLASHTRTNCSTCSS